MSHNTTAEEADTVENDIPNPHSPSSGDELDIYLDELFEECIQNDMHPSTVLSVLDKHERKMLELDRMVREQDREEN